MQVVGFGLNAMIRGEGNPKIAMLTLLISVVLNAILAPILIFGLGWGMKGAALATVLAQAVGAVWVLGYFFSGRSVLRFHARNLRLKWGICRQILLIGSPPFAMQLAAAVMNSLLNNQLDKYGGVEAISIIGIIYPVMMMIAMPIFGLNQGAQPIIGYNYGAQRFDRVKRTLEVAVLAATSFTLAGFFVAMLLPAQVVRSVRQGRRSPLRFSRGVGNSCHANLHADHADRRFSDHQRELFSGGGQTETGDAPDALPASPAADTRGDDHASLLRPRRRLGRYPDGRCLLLDPHRRLPRLRVASSAPQARGNDRVALLRYVSGKRGTGSVAQTDTVSGQTSSPRCLSPFFRGTPVVRRKRGQAPSPEAVFAHRYSSKRRSQSPFTTADLAQQK